MAKFHSLIVFTFEILSNICNVFCCCPVCNVKNLEINLSFLIKIRSEKVTTNCKYLNNKNSF